MAAFKEPKKFGVIPGNAADVTAIQDAGSVLNPSMADIFPAIYQVPLGQGGKAPERTTFNQFFKLYGEALYFLQRGGVWSYDATADYPAGAVVGYSGSLYLALGENGPGTGTGAVTPGKNTSVWQKLVLESGNAASATKLAAARTINGTAFNGTANITTANWGTARNISIADATATNTGEAVSVNGSAAVTLKLPAAIKANVTGSLTGNAATATKLAAKRTIALSGAATGTATGFDGSGNITIPVTALDASKLTGTASVSLVPAGVIIPFAGTSVPTGYLLCNGAAVSRTGYANLFAAIGTLYGAGNGSTTFNLPDARDRVLQGASGKHSVGSYIAAGLPNIAGFMAQGIQCAAIQGTNGVFYESDTRQHNAAQNNDGSSTFPAYVFFNASRSSTIYGASATVQSPAIATNFIIKY